MPNIPKPMSTRYVVVTAGTTEELQSELNRYDTLVPPWQLHSWRVHNDTYIAVLAKSNVNVYDNAASK